MLKREDRSGLGSLARVAVHSFVVIPFLIAILGVSLYASVRALTVEERDVFQILEDVRDGGTTRRWQAAYTLSRLLADPERVPDGERFISALMAVFEQAKHDPDASVRQYLALAMGRSGRRDFAGALLAALDQDPAANRPFILHGLGLLGDPETAPAIRPYTGHEDVRVRLQAVIALGNLGGEASKPTLRNALSDPENNVRWDAAVALAKLGDDTGKGVLLDLLDREYLSAFEAVDAEEEERILLTAIRAGTLLQDPALNGAIRRLAEHDPRMEIRKAALAAVGPDVGEGAT